MAKANIILVREFLNKETSKPVTLGELQLFWKGLTEEEKNQCGAEVRALCPGIEDAPGAVAA
jgi:hypothetical protein